MADPKGYTSTQIVLHWLTALGVIVAFLSHGAMEDAFDALLDSGGAPYPTPHTIAGFCVFLLVAIRLILRVRRLSSCWMARSMGLAVRMRLLWPSGRLKTVRPSGMLFRIHSASFGAGCSNGPRHARACDQLRRDLAR